MSGLLLIIVAASTIAAPDICVRSDELKVPIVYGRVVYSWKGSKEEPIPNATIQVSREVGDELKLVGTATADNNGYFHINNIALGRYKISVSANNFKSWSARLKVVKASKYQKIEKQIVFVLEPFVSGACGDARVEKIQSK